MDTPYTTKNGELTTKGALISEIESLLNTLSVSSHATSLSPEIMRALACEDLESIRDSLLAKDHIAQHSEWLKGLSSKD
ncbi:hypothetical protein [uncultured Helicobacter sp.]|uniref:hypothetical protein n=1 Tax=uncultured Helicobacter sp. TaxID=175537 RepID=UPI00374F3EE6